MKKIILIMILVSVGFSAPAFRGDIEFEQKDGSLFIGNLQGDEWFSWVEDKENNIIVYNRENKNYEYALVKDNNGTFELLSSGIKVNNLNKKTFSIGTSSSFIPKIDKEKLFKIWKRKRKEGLKKEED